MKNKNILLITTILVSMLWISSSYFSWYSYEAENITEIPKNELKMADLGLEIDWNITLGGTGFDSSTMIKLDNSDNIFLSARTDNFGAGGQDALLIKLDSMGNEQWNVSWGSSETDWGQQIAFDSSNNIWHSGRTNGFGPGTIPNANWFLIKYDYSGIQLWNRSWGTGEGEFQGGRIDIDSNDNLYYSGWTWGHIASSSYIALIKYDNSGVPQWTEYWGTGNRNNALDTYVDTADYIFVTGGAGSTTNMDACLLKYDSDGNLDWSRTWGGAQYERAYSVQGDSSGHLYIAGETATYGVNTDAFLLKYNNSGDLEWSRTWGGSNFDVAEDILIDYENNIYIVGRTDSFGDTDGDVFIAKYSSAGDQLWNMTWGGNNADTAYSITMDSLGNILVAGNTYSYGAGDSDIFVLKLTGSEISMSEWEYYREITLNPTTPTDDYQVKIVLDPISFNYSHAAHDGRDIRFLDQGENYVSYWVEKWDNSSTSIIWVKMPSAGTSQIRMYYGNPTAVSLSNGFNTFEFFDDFSGTSLNPTKWNTEIGTYTGISVSNGYVRVYSDAPNTFVERAYFGFTEDYFIQGSPFSWVYPYESISISLAEDTSWHTNEIRWTNLTAAPYLKNDVYVSNDTTLEDTTLPVKFIAHSAYSGPGSPWGAWIWTKDDYLGQMGRGLRIKSWVDLTNIADFRVDWVAVFNYNESNPSVTIGTETNVGPNVIIINSPLTNSIYGTSAPEFNITIIDPMYNYTWYSLDGGTTNVYSNETEGTISQTEWDKQGHGLVTISFYANNSLGIISQAQVTVRKDLLPPDITINTPVTDQVVGVDAPSFDLTILDYVIDSTWYTLDNGNINVSFSGMTGLIDQTEWGKKGGGTVPIRFYANDSFGNLGFSDVIVVKDLISPIVTINSPSGGNVFGDTPPDFDISVTEANPDSMWYTLDSGATNITFGSLTGTIDQTEWDKHGNGTVTITFYALDEGGNEGFAERIVRKDVNIPLITINSPGTADNFGVQPPQYDLTVVEPNIDSMWYTLDYGITTIPFTELTGTIDQVEWEKYGNGPVVIRFYVRDEGDNEAFSEISINKDLIVPIVTINQPTFGQVFAEISPLYSITIDETSLDSFWYSLDSGQTNHTITEISGAISQSVWDSHPNGHLTLRFYARDEAGNIGQNSVTITKDAAISRPPGIPGYNLFNILGVLGALSIIIIRKKTKTKY